jgi:anti-sigma factor RsiW
MSIPDDILNNGDKGRLPEDMLMAYLEGRLSPGQQHEVEAWLAEEGMEGDAIEGLKELPAADTKHLVQHLNANLHHTLAKNKRKHRPIKDNQWAWLAVLIILLLVILGYVVINMMVK